MANFIDPKTLYDSFGQYIQSNLFYLFAFIFSIILLYIISKYLYHGLKESISSKWQFVYFLVTAIAIYLTIKLIPLISFKLPSYSIYILMALIIRLCISFVRFISLGKGILNKGFLIYLVVDLVVILVINLIFSDIGITENILVILFTAVWVRLGESLVNLEKIRL